MRKLAIDRHEYVSECVGEHYTLHQVRFCPTELGFPARRPRKYCILLNRDSWRWRSDAEVFEEGAFMRMFGRSLAASGMSYLQDTTAQEINKAVENMAASRHMPLRDGKGKRWPMILVLPRGARVRLTESIERLEAVHKTDPRTGDFFILTCQNIEFSSFGAGVTL